MKGIKKFLKKLDIFGVNLNFKYKADDTYTTALGGLVILLFCGVALGFGIKFVLDNSSPAKAYESNVRNILNTFDSRSPGHLSEATYNNQEIIDVVLEHLNELYDNSESIANDMYSAIYSAYTNGKITKLPLVCEHLSQYIYDRD